MTDKYREIRFGAGDRIKEAVEKLKAHDDLVCGVFNGITLYSDIDDMDSAYKKIIGKTKDEFDEFELKLQEEYKAENKRYEESIPELTKEWVEKSKNILDEKYHELWSKMVPIRLADLYKGFELGACLEIIGQLNLGCNLDVAKGIIEEQGHSGMSFSLVCSMISSLCDRGNEFVKYVK